MVCVVANRDFVQFNLQNTCSVMLESCYIRTLGFSAKEPNS